MERKYELALLVDPAAEGPVVQEVLGDCKAVQGRSAGLVDPLAYTIKGYTRANLEIVCLLAEPEKAAALEQRAREHKAVVRHLLVRVANFTDLSKIKLHAEA